MALTYRYCLDWVQHQLGGNVDARVQAARVIRSAGQWFCAEHPWNFMNRVPAELTLVEGQDHIELPADFRDAISDPKPLPGTSTPLMQIVTLDELARRRAVGSTEANDHYWGAYSWAADRRPRLEIYPTPGAQSGSTPEVKNRLFYSSQIIDQSADPTTPWVYEPVEDIGTWVFGCDNDNGIVGNVAGNPVHPLDDPPIKYSWASKCSFRLAHLDPPDGSTHENDRPYLITRSEAATPGNSGCVRQGFLNLNNTVDSPHPTGFVQEHNCLSVWVKYHDSEFGHMALAWRNGGAANACIAVEWQWSDNGDYHRTLTLNPDGVVIYGGDDSIYNGNNHGIATDVWENLDYGSEQHFNADGTPSGWWRVWVTGDGTAYGVSTTAFSPYTPATKVRQVFLIEQMPDGFATPPVAPDVLWTLSAGTYGVGRGTIFYGPQLENSRLPTDYQPIDQQSPRVVETDPSFSIIYRAEWPDTLDEDDTLPIPGYAEPAFLDALSCFVLGIEERDVATVSQRLADLRNGALWDAAISRDGEGGTTLGQLRGGAYGMGYMHEPIPTVTFEQ